MGEIPVRKILFSVLLLGVASLVAGTVQLVNDSPYKLRSVIRAVDGSYLGEVVVNPTSTNTWTDGFQGLPGSLDSVRSQTPYTVEWYCLDGSSYSTCTFVTTGGTVTARNCQGARQCRSRDLQQGQKGGVQPAQPLPIPIPEQQQQAAPQNNAQPKQQQPQQQRTLQFPAEYPAVQESYQSPQVLYPSEQ